MAKATELDKDLADGLKAAKSKRCYFVLIIKGSNDGALLVSKTKVPPADIAAAKKRAGSSTSIDGFCKVEDGKHIFETADKAPATAAQAAKTIANRDAGQTIHAEFRVSSDPELLAQAKPSTTATPHTTTGESTSPKSGKGTADDAKQDSRKAGLQQRRGAIMEWLKTVKAEPGKDAVVQELAPLLQQCDQALKSGDLNEAEQKLVVLENHQKLGRAAGEKKPEASGNDAKAAELQARRGAIMEWLKEINAEPKMAAVVQKLAPVLQQFDQVMKKGDLVEAEKKLVLLENYQKLGAAAGSKSKEPAASLDAALREQQEKEAKLQSQIDGIQAQLAKRDYEKLLAEFKGKSMEQIDKELFKQSQEALDAVVASNKELLNVSVGQEKSDPAGIAGKWQKKVAEDEKKKDEIERKRDMVRQIQDGDFPVAGDANVQAPQNPEDEEKLRQKLAAAETEIATAQQAKEFYSEMRKLVGTISKATAESPEIGGADVSVTFENAKRQANAGNWEQASQLLAESHRKAELVLMRKPFLTAKLAHEPKINAARKIKQVNPNTDKKFGEEVDAKWKEILALAKDDHFDEAARETMELVQRIDTEIALALKSAREDNGTKLGELKQQLETEKNDPQKLRKIAIAIFKNTAEAEDLGIDPGENARKPFTEGTVGNNVWNVGNCEITFKKYDWFALKKCRKAGAIELEKGKPLTFTDDDMWKLVQFRGKVVNEEIDKLRKIYPTLIAKASGSEDIESDIDITFATPASGDDVKAAQAFNKVVITRFGKPPGRVFDVNIYPRDYGAIKESFKPDYNVDAIEDENIDEPEDDASLKLSKVDQDVATLLKQRRFLEESQFNEMLQTLMDQTPDQAVRDRIEKQFEEGEDIYLQTSLEKVAKIRTKVDLGKALPDGRADKHRVTLNEEIRKLDALKGKGGKENLKLAQKLVPEILDLFEETFPAESMDVTDALYLEKMGSLRQDQASIRENEESVRVLNEAPAAHAGKTCKESGHDICDWQTNLTAVESKLNALEVKVKKNMFTNIIFANEAIMSQGALKHVVQALQAKTLEEKMEKLEKLTAEDLMQSVNEQVADLFKEMKHYDGVVKEAEENAPEKEKASAKNRANGEGYVHASKYFFRLLDAAISLNLKYPNEATVQLPYDAVKSKGNMSLQELKTQVDDVLLKLRKSAVIPPEVKGEVGALEMQEIFPQVTDIPSFRTMISDFAIELNKRIRSLAQFKQSEKDKEKEKGAQREYGGVAETEQDKALGRIRALASKPGEMPTDLVATLTKLGVKPSPSAGLFDAWQAVLNAEPPRDLGDLRSKVNAISNTEAADELQAVVHWFENANTMHTATENQETRAVANEIKKATASIENAEKLLGRATKLTSEAKSAGRKLSEEEKKPLLAEIENMKTEINSAQENINNAAPQAIPQPVAKMIDEITSELQRIHGNLDRRTVELAK